MSRARWILTTVQTGISCARAPARVESCGTSSNKVWYSTSEEEVRQGSWGGMK